MNQFVLLQQRMQVEVQEVQITVQLVTTIIHFNNVPIKLFLILLEINGSFYSTMS